LVKEYAESGLLWDDLGILGCLEVWYFMEILNFEESNAVIHLAMRLAQRDSGIITP
jgi:hypothetical protein